LLIDKGSKNRGIPEDELYIPAYNGGLFRTEVDEETSRESEFLQENKVGDSYLAEVIDLLTRHESKNGEGRVFVDYSSLDIRHLGSIYEGLLEYHLNVASESMIAVKEDKEEKWYSKEDYEGDGNVVEELDEGEVYLTTDKGERKATGSYYTPEYIVQYIVENTLDPILDEIREDLLREGRGNFAHRFAERVFELKVLDPAMGSGHFLTNAVDHLAREIVNAHEKQAEEEGAETVDESHDIHWARRQVAQKCIYGVDLNDMAVELAKVSLWLRTLAAQKPLAFLDHHLKTGNSLIGSDIEEIEELDSGKKKESEVNSTTLDDFGMTKKGTMEDLMRIYQDFIKIENQDLEDIKEMEEKYHEFEHEPIRERLEAMANVHTAREFDVDVPESSFGKMAQAIDDEGKWKEVEDEDWFEKAQEMAGEKEFFHWKLAFPEVFYEEEGEKKEDDGFDVVIGNPPYISTSLITKDDREYYRGEFNYTGKEMNTFSLFIEKSLNLQSKGSFVSFIVPDSLLNVKSYSKLRKGILKKCKIERFLQISGGAFLDAEVGNNVVFIFNKKESEDQHQIMVDRKEDEGIVHTNRIYQKSYKNTPEFTFYLDNETIEFLTRFENKTDKLGEICELRDGVKTGNNSKYISTEKENDNWKRVLEGSDIGRHLINYKGKYMLYDREKLDGPRQEWIFLEEKKIIIRQTGDELISAIDTNKFYTTDSTHLILNDKNEQSLEFINAILNSKFMNYYHNLIVPERDRAYAQIRMINLEKLPIRKVNWIDTEKRIRKIEKIKDQYEKHLNSIKDNSSLINIFDMLTSNKEYKLNNLHDFISFLNEKTNKIKTKKESFNLNIVDYLGNYSEGKTLQEFYTPMENVSSSILSETVKDKQKLRIGNIEFEENDDELILKVSARYKPENPEDHKTDRWGYTETELIPAMKFRGDEMELALIREFTKLAVDEAGGFANFRESATKTKSILDRLEKLTLPKLSDVESGLEKYLEQKEKAERLEEEIKETDHTIDAIVFDLYDLTEEEVEVVLDSLDRSETKKADILEKFVNIKV